MSSAVVLVVDDDPDVRSLMEMALRSAGIDVVPADSGDAALGWVRQHGPPAAVVLDVQMPALDGWATLDRLRTLTDGLPVLMCTVKVRDADRARAAYVSFLPKPFGVEQLTGAVRHLLADAPASAPAAMEKPKESPR